MARIFICYRRDEDRGLAGRVYDRLRSHFGEEFVFMDIQTIPFGVDFREHIGQAVSKCDILVAMIGPHWLVDHSNGKRRLDDPRDFVRIELSVAFERKIPVIPVLIEGASIPTESELPDQLASLAYRQGIKLDARRDFDSHLSQLIASIETLVSSKAEPIANPILPTSRCNATIDQATPRSRQLIQCAGTIDGLQPNMHAWLAVEVNGLIWPKEPEILPDDHGNWSATIVDGGTAPYVGVELYVIDDTVDQEFRDWLSEGHASGHYPGFRPTRKMRRLARVARVPLRV